MARRRRKACLVALLASKRTRSLHLELLARGGVLGRVARARWPSDGSFHLLDSHASRSLQVLGQFLAGLLQLRAPRESDAMRQSWRVARFGRTDNQLCRRVVISRGLNVFDVASSTSEATISIEQHDAFVIAAILVIVGVVQLLQGQILLRVVLIVLGCLVGPGGYSVLRGRRAQSYSRFR